LALEPDNALAWANKAVILSGLNRRPEAIRCYERSLAIDPSNKTTWFNKGVSLARLTSLLYETRMLLLTSLIK
jgi:tetratricopeptide (TPR) repeat protein